MMNPRILASIIGLVICQQSQEAKAQTTYFAMNQVLYCSCKVQFINQQGQNESRVFGMVGGGQEISGKCLSLASDINAKYNYSHRLDKQSHFEQKNSSSQVVVKGSVDPKFLGNIFYWGPQFKAKGSYGKYDHSDSSWEDKQESYNRDYNPNATSGLDGCFILKPGSGVEGVAPFPLPVR